MRFTLQPLKRLICLSHVLRVFAERLPRCTLFSDADDGWKLVKGCQSVALYNAIKAATNVKTHVTAVRPPSLGPGDRPNGVWKQ